MGVEVGVGSRRDRIMVRGRAHLPALAGAFGHSGLGSGLKLGVAVGEGRGSRGRVMVKVRARLEALTSVLEHSGRAEVEIR